MSDDKIFNIFVWEKLIAEINQINNIMILREQSEIKNITDSKEELQFFKNNIDKIFSHCTNTDFLRINFFW